MAISNQAFQHIQKMMGSWSGVVLSEREKYLVEARLLPVARQQKMNSVEELIDTVQKGSANGLPNLVLEALLPKETHFFRDNHPFELLRNQVFRALEGSRFRECRLRIWCAGCGAGQEAYSVAMVLHRYFSHLLSWQIEILATDISQQALAKAQQGQYDEIEVHRGVQPLLIREFFRKDGPHYFIKEDLIRLVQFAEFNLIDNWPELPAADLVLLRNVLCYMAPDTRKKILSGLKNVLKPDGYLFLGARESAAEIDESYEMVPTEKTVYFRLLRSQTGP
ncbi:MAG: protein-glutamate O-methyltransferase CheR [Verrucomicrobia bacterium]|nr:protein-glutamate O-methyltransferase CheR [Verrucomicrobiota bacterium]